MPVDENDDENDAPSRVPTARVLTSHARDDASSIFIRSGSRVSSHVHAHVVPDERVGRFALTDAEIQPRHLHHHSNGMRRRVWIDPSAEPGSARRPRAIRRRRRYGDESRRSTSRLASRHRRSRDTLHERPGRDSPHLGTRLGTRFGTLSSHRGGVEGVRASVPVRASIDVALVHGGDDDGALGRLDGVRERLRPLARALGRDVVSRGDEKDVWVVFERVDNPRIVFVGWVRGDAPRGDPGDGEGADLATRERGGGEEIARARAGGDDEDASGQTASGDDGA